MTKKQKRVLIRIIVSTVLLAAAIILDKTLELSKYLAAAIYLVPYFVIGYDILKKAVLGIFHGQIFDENFLMAVATVGAVGLGDYKEGVAVMLFYQIGEEQKKHIFTYGYPPRLCKHRKRRKACSR